MMKLSSGKCRLAAALLLAGIMALAGPAFGQGNANIINIDDTDISGNYPGGLTIIPVYDGSIQDITATLADNGTLNVTGDMSAQSNENGAKLTLVPCLINSIMKCYIINVTNPICSKQFKDQWA